MVSWPPIIITAEVFVHEGMNRTMVLEVVALLEEDLTVDEELLSPGPKGPCALAHIAKARVNKITRVIDLYHTNRSFLTNPISRAI